MLTAALLRGLLLFDVLPTPKTTTNTMMTFDLTYYLMILYLVGFSALLGTAEYRWPSTLIYLEFLRSRLGKGLFLVLIGLLVFDDRSRYDVMIGIAMVLVGVFNVIVSCMRRDVDQSQWEER